MPGICLINAHVAHFGPILAHFQAYLGHMPDFASQGESPWFGPARDLANFGGAVKICPAYAWARKLPRNPPRHASGIFRAYASGAKTSRDHPRHASGICLPILVIFGHLLGIFGAYCMHSGICQAYACPFFRHMPGICLVAKTWSSLMV